MITPYCQQYVVTMKSGAVVLVTVHAVDRREGERAALDAVRIKPGGEVWSFCGYPWDGETRADGVEILREPCE